MSDNKFEELLQFAIHEETNAARLYESIAEKINSRTTQKTLQDMAAMEWDHKRKIESFKETGSARFPQPKQVEDLHISDYMVSEKLNPDSDPQDVLVFAMKEEQKAYELYSRLASIADHEKTRALFEALAGEEKQHKYRLEKEYEDSTFSWEN